MIDVEIFKKPLHEDDSFNIKIKNFKLTDDELTFLSNDDPYLNLKRQLFKTKNIEKENFLNYKYRPSFRNFDKIVTLEGTIYTYAVNDRNGIQYELAVNLIKNMLLLNPKTKRCVLRTANSFLDYYLSEASGKDVSCLSLIHYFDKSVTLIFRASDIKNELYVDLITIYEFFIKPVYNCNIDISIFANCAQNIDQFENFIKNVNNI